MPSPYLFSAVLEFLGSDETEERNGHYADFIGRRATVTADDMVVYTETPKEAMRSWSPSNPGVHPADNRAQPVEQVGHS